MKGKKQWLISDSDIQEMYKKHLGKPNILLWAYTFVQNSSKNKATKRTDSNFAEHKENLTEVDKHYDELRKKHGNSYSLEQFRMWAQLIRLGKQHTSIDEPPDKPFWRGRK